MRRFWFGFISILAIASLYGANGGPTTIPSATDLSKEEVVEKLQALSSQGQTSCEAMVVTVNGLRHLGKEDALKVLRQFYSITPNYAAAHEEREMTIICVCRVLFVPPKAGWTIPWVGFQAMGERPTGYNKAAEQKFPLYPMALSNGVPFFLNSGWNTPNGRMSRPIPDEGSKTLDLCDTLKLVPQDLTTSGYEDAAQKLFESDEFKNLVSGGNVLPTRIQEMILEQTKTKPRFNSKTPPSTSAATQRAMKQKP